MFTEFHKQNKDKDPNGKLEFNSGEGGVNITTEILQKLKEAIENDYEEFDYEVHYWTKKQDEEFVSWAENALKDGKEVGYDCCW